MNSSTSHAASSAADPTTIVVYHVGGEEGYGPITSILERMKRHVRLVVFEAREGTADEAFVEHMVKDGIPVSIIRTGIDERQGNSEFYVNKFPLSSSLLPASPLSLQEDPSYGHCFSWGENVELDRIIRVDTTSIDELVGDGSIPPPDVISIDAQGAELRILRGAAKTLTDHVMCVVSEVEFFEIYRTQGLFDDQMALLGQKGFRLFNLLNQQFWHPGPRCGSGFLTVAEAVFLLCVKNIPGDDRSCVSLAKIDSNRLMRLGAIAMSFGAFSYAAQLASFVRNRSRETYEKFREEGEYRHLIELADLVADNMPAYQHNKNVFLDNLLFSKRLVAGEPVVAEYGFSMRPGSPPKSASQDGQEFPRGVFASVGAQTLSGLRSLRRIARNQKQSGRFGKALSRCRDLFGR